MNRTTKLAERGLKQLISVSVKNKTLENAEYEKLYDEIQVVSNNIINFCGLAEINGSINDVYSLQLLNKLRELSSELSDTAHELEEHLAWD